ncbi:MAG: RnfABCDGE type electron transport complex subunit G [Candidatus Omnitrophica bacterium]|jgi:electron transport complex protein RnfG|nr:RnfABCDGE type electron transport complex subunit G [Candidatus Omnitrophota bacterium]
MKKIFKTTIVLTTISVICGFLLAFVSALTEKPIAANQHKKIGEAISKLSPAVKKIEEAPLKDEQIYKLFDQKQSLIGYAVVAEGPGYQGQIKIVAVTDSAFATLEGIQVIESSETPGLGAKITEDFFTKQFKGTKLASPLECTKEKTDKGDKILAISGATISSRAAVNIVNNELQKIKQEITEIK